MVDEKEATALSIVDGDAASDLQRRLTQCELSFWSLSARKRENPSVNSVALEGTPTADENRTELGQLEYSMNNICHTCNAGKFLMLPKKRVTIALLNFPGLK